MSNAKETKETKEDKAKEMRTTASEIGTEEELPKPPQLKPKMFIAPIVLMGSKRLGIDWNDEDTKLKIRMAFTISVTVCYLVIFYMYKQVKRKEKKLSEDTVEVTAKDPYNNGEEKKETLTYYEHDLREVKKAGTSQAFGFLMTSVLHFYFKLNPPIVLQTIMLPLNMMETPAFQVHVLEKDGSANKKLQRPWMPEEKPNPFADLAKAMSPPPPEKKKSEKEAKKNGEKEDAKRK
jgi:hypothetical protein|tara:strand:- start:2091 stop:2795 length:705 start_codon:yes stop_codon:yes gene_type:complete|mmetsp:Transcript_9722/g.28045  ORF Transcript_9722/g.28045 Transcript_9722/m.28045 type:complete len:235 (+) Transcript_9722:272-976(+)